MVESKSVRSQLSVNPTKVEKDHNYHDDTCKYIYPKKTYGEKLRKPIMDPHLNDLVHHKDMN